MSRKHAFWRKQDCLWVLFRGHVHIHVTGEVVERKSQTVPDEERIVCDCDEVCKIGVYNSIDTIFERSSEMQMDMALISTLGMRCFWRI
jgi:hypothetical protein